MRHGQSPRYADVPCAWQTGSASLALRSFRLSPGYPSLLPRDSRRLEWQFSDPLSTHQNKVRHVTKEPQYGSRVGHLTQVRGIERRLCLLLALLRGHLASLGPSSRLRAVGQRRDREPMLGDELRRLVVNQREVTADESAA